MTISSATSRNDYVGNGSVDTYSYNFQIFEDTDLVVIVKDTDDVETALTLTTHYTVSGAGDASGGSVSLVSGAFDWLNATDDLKTDYTITIRRVLPLKQETDIRNQGDFYPEVHEDQFDRFISIDQQQQDDIDRSVKMPESVSASEFNPELPASLSGSANATIVTNATGDAFAVGPTTTAIENAESNANDAAASATLAEEWASKIDGQVDSTDYSSKAWSIGGTDVTETASRGAAKEWATKTDNPVDTSEYSAKEYAQGTQSGTGGSAKDWAIETSSDVDSTGEYSAKEHAQGTQTRGASGGGSAKDWATYTGGTVDDTEYSAKYYAQQADTSATEAADAAAASQWSDVVYVTNGDSPISITDNDTGKLYNCDCTSGDIVFNLPAISGLTLDAPWVIGVKKTDSSANQITVNRNGTDTIDGGTSVTVTIQNRGKTIIPDADSTPDDWTTIEFGAMPSNTAYVDATQTFTGANTFDEIITNEKETQFQELSTTPSTPASGYKKLYPKDDGLMYTLDDAGLEVPVGTGSGGGLDVFYTEDFFITNETAFTTSRNTNFGGAGTFGGTLDIEESTPISGNKSLKYTQGSPSANDNIVSEAISLDPKQEEGGQWIGVNFWYKYDGDDDDIRFVLWDDTNDKEITDGSELLKEATSPKRFADSYFIPDGVSTIKWGFQVEVENNGAILLADDVEMSTRPFDFREVVNITDWQNGGEIELSNTSGSTTKGTRSVDTVRWRRVGDSMEILMDYLQTGTGSDGSGEPLFKIPGGYKIDSQKLVMSSSAHGSGYNITPNGSSVGFAQLRLSASTVMVSGAVVVYDDEYVRIVGNAMHTNNDSVYPGSAIDGWGTFDLSDFYLKLRMTVPIVGWRSAAEHVVTPARQTLTNRTAWGTLTTVGMSTSASDVYYQRVGDTMKVFGTMTVTSPGSSSAGITMRSGVTIDHSLGKHVCGWYFRTNGTVSSHGGTVFTDGSTNRVYLANPSLISGSSTGSGATEKESANTIFGSGEPVSFYFEVKIEEWTSDAVFLAALPVNYTQEKNLTSNVTTTGDISDLQCSNLVVGNWYTVTLKLASQASSNPVEVNLYSGASQAGTLYDAQRFDSSGTSFGKVSFVSTFKAVSTNLYVNVNSISDTIYGNDTKTQTHLRIEERNDLRETNRF